VSPNAVERLTEARRSRPWDYPGNSAGAERLRLDKLREAGWEEPVPLSGPALASLPVEVLPGPLGEMVQAVTVEQQVPPDLPALLGLGTLSAAVGGRVEVLVQDGWAEPVLLWGAAVLPPGQQKSSAMRRMRRPLDDAERRLIAAAADQVVTRTAERDIAEKRARKLAEKAAGEKATSTSEAEALDAWRRLGRLDELHPPKLTVGDATPEALSRLLAEQGGRLALMDAEGGAFGTIAGRYNGMPKVDEVNKGYDCEPIKVDRVGRPALSVERPALTLALAVQPDVIRQAGREPALRHRGLLDRFTYAVPSPTVGTRTELRPDAVPVAVVARWAVLVDSLVAIPAATDGPVTLRLSERAWQEHARWRSRLEPRLRPGEGDLSVIGGWAAKHAGRIARIAGLLHLAAHPALDVREINVDTMRAALAVGDWAIPHALAAFDLADNRPDLAPPRSVLRWVQREARERFTLREAHQALRGQSWVTSAGAVRAAVEILIEHGYARSAPIVQSGPGRPTERYEMHPEHRIASSKSSKPPTVSGSEDIEDVQGRRGTS